MGATVLKLVVVDGGNNPDEILDDAKGQDFSTLVIGDYIFDKPR